MQVFRDKQIVDEFNTLTLKLDFLKDVIAVLGHSALGILHLRFCFVQFRQTKTQ